MPKKNLNKHISAYFYLILILLITVLIVQFNERILLYIIL